MSGSRSVADYYRDVSWVYDFNRRFFLFGRKRLIRKLADEGTQFPRILEVGCGTGTALLELHRLFPESEIVGLDLSESMLDVAREKTAHIPSISLVQEKFDEEFVDEPFDLIVFSYALSVFPDLEATLELTRERLGAGGSIAMVDFFGSNYGLFRLWISRNIPIRTHFPLPALLDRFQQRDCDIRNAYFGFWKYFLFIGTMK